MLPNTLMSVVQTGEINVEELRRTEGLIVKEPLGELDLLWIMSNLPKNWLDMKLIRFSTSDEKFEFTVTDGEASAKIEMTDFLVEVER